MTGAPLVAVAHGTRSATGQQQIRALVAEVAGRRPGLDVRLTYVDVQQPRIAETMRDIRPAVIVPLLLSTGYHVRVDIAEAAGSSVVTPPLGPDPVLTEILTEQAGHDHDALILAAAGSSDPGWQSQVSALAADLNAHVAYAGRNETKDVVAALRREGAERITVAAYFLADGLFYRSLHAAGADRVTPPLCHDPRLPALITHRYTEAAALTHTS
jgi:sirohydrochlorin ferrochelatase